MHWHSKKNHYNRIILYNIIEIHFDYKSKYIAQVIHNKNIYYTPTKGCHKEDESQKSNIII
jgi:hypothetical protein